MTETTEALSATGVRADRAKGQGVLIDLRILSAAGLVAPVDGEVPTPFVTAKTTSDHKAKAAARAATAVAAPSLNPIWNQSLRFSVDRAGVV